MRYRTGARSFVRAVWKGMMQMSVAKIFEAKEVVCPFYKHEQGFKLFCEGIYGKTIIQTFDGYDHKMMHKQQYCHDLDSCKQCRIYQAVDAKYGRW